MNVVHAVAVTSALRVNARHVLSEPPGAVKAHARLPLLPCFGLEPIHVCAQLIPVGAVQALVNVQLLNKIPPFHQLLKIQFTNALIVSILPGKPGVKRLVLNVYVWSFTVQQAHISSITPARHLASTRRPVYLVQRPEISGRRSAG